MNHTTQARSYVYRRGRTARTLSALIVLSAAALVIAAGLGSARIPFSDTLRTLWERIAGTPHTDATAAIILFSIRLPRVILAYTVGAALSVSGASMQGVFKNPMADPYLMGISSGAALGAAVAIIFRLQLSAMGMGAVSACAFLGAAAALLIVLSLAGRKTSTVSLLLSGVAVGAFLTALLSGLLALNRESTESVYLWTMGSFSAASWPKVAVAVPVVAGATLLLRVFARDLNAMLLGDSSARTLGISVEKVRAIIIALCTAATATAVAMCGVIGFVGLMAPHAVRLIIGPDHRSLLPVSALAGGLFLLIMDTLARTVIMPLELPVGVLTALVGGPFFLLMLRRNRNAQR